MVGGMHAPQHYEIRSVNAQVVRILLECILVLILFSFHAAILFYHPQQSWGKVMFSQACVILFMGGCLPQCTLGYHHIPKKTPPRSTHPPGSRPPRSTLGYHHIPEKTPSQEHTPPWEQTPQEHTPRKQTPPGADTPPWCRACWEIRSTRGRYASYWNAILSDIFSLPICRSAIRSSHFFKNIPTPGCSWPFRCGKLKFTKMQELQPSVETDLTSI